MAIQQKKAGGKKLRRCTRRSPSEARNYARAIGKPRKKGSYTSKGNYVVLQYEPYMENIDNVPTLRFNVKHVKAHELKR